MIIFQIWKDGGKINVYGNGYYQEESGWHVPGYRNFIADDAVKESEGDTYHPNK